jgi:lipopolysaccharide/colanic/teichoic acid biosynthesis glycosyltransferase
MGQAANMIKRLLDIVASGIGLAILSPLLAVVALLVKCTSRGPVFFRHERIGKNFQPFHVLKFRSMVHDSPRRGGPITFGDDPRITRFGAMLRKTKIDELPQLLNVFRGEMSLVGPRPEVRRYVEMYRPDYEVILRIRPGITDLASLKFRDESTLLGRAADPEYEYAHHILPEKIRLAQEYVAKQSVFFDLKIILGTLGHLIRDRLPGQAIHGIEQKV